MKQVLTSGVLPQTIEPAQAAEAKQLIATVNATSDPVNLDGTIVVHNPAQQMEVGDLEAFKYVLLLKVKI